MLQESIYKYATLYVRTSIYPNMLFLLSRSVSGKICRTLLTVAASGVGKA